MKRVFPILLVLLFALTPAFARDAKPNMVIDKEIFDAGVVVRSAEPIEHAFLIKNTGTGELKIFEVKPG